MPTSLTSLIGAAKPRVEVRPPAGGTLGDVAVALAERAGLPLEPWQVDGLRIMMALRPDGKWAAFEYAELVARQQGKTGGLLAPRALAGFLVLGERLIMWSAHEYKTAMESFLLVRSLLRALGEDAGPNLIDVDGVVVKVNNTNGEEGFERLDTGARIKYIARSKSSGRGFSGDCNLIDEAFAYTRLHQSALMPTTNARPNPQIVYASSPPLDGDTGEPLFALRERAEGGNADGLAWRDWGVAGCLEDLLALPADERREFLDDRSVWAAASPALGRGRVTEESLLRNRRSMSDRDFAREVLGMWPRRVNRENGWAVIPRASWQARGGALGRPEEAIVFAVAAAYPDAELGSIAVAGRSDDDAGATLVQVVEHRPGTAWIPDRVVDLIDRHRPAAVLLDCKGPARHLIPALKAAGVELEHPAIDDVVQAAAMFYAASAGDAPSLRHYDQIELDAALASAQKRLLGDGWTWMRRGSTDISPLEAVTLAAWGHARYGDNSDDQILW